MERIELKSEHWQLRIEKGKLEKNKLKLKGETYKILIIVLDLIT